jgi:hypothetical protein
MDYTTPWWQRIEEAVNGASGACVDYGNTYVPNKKA